MTTARKRFAFGLVCAGVAAATLSAQEIGTKEIADGFANPARWLSYSGDYTGRRFSPLTQIAPGNVSQLSAQWTFQTAVVNKFENSPIVVDGTLLLGNWKSQSRLGR